MKKSYVYFVAAPGRIKIGFTTKPEQRLVQLKSMDMEPLSMVAIIDGTRKLEAHLHKLCLPYLHHREWFHDCPEVRQIIQDAVDGKISAEPTPEQIIVNMQDSADYYEFKRLPILDARALASRLYREFLEEILEAINRRKAEGRPYGDLATVMQKIDPDFIKAKWEAVEAAKNVA